MRTARRFPRKTLIFPFLLLALTLIFPAQSSWSGARDSIQIPAFKYHGTGCSAGTVTAMLTSEKQGGTPVSLELSMNQYQTQTGTALNRHVSRKTCDLTLPIELPPGLKIAIHRLEYNGHHSLPEGAVSAFKLGHYFKNPPDPDNPGKFKGSPEKTYSIRKLFYGEQDQNFEGNLILETDPKGNSTPWSPCGGVVQLNLITSLVTETNLNQDSASTSLNLSRGLIFYFHAMQCEN